MWGLHDFLARFATLSRGTAAAVAGVTVAGALWLSVLLWWSGSYASLFSTLDTALLWQPALAGVAIVAATAFFFAALARGPFSVVAPIGASYPLVVVLVSVALGASLRAVDWVAIAAVFIGVVCVTRGVVPETSGHEGGNATRLVPVLLAAGAALCFGAGVLSGQQSAVSFGEVEGSWLARIFGVASLPLLMLLPARPSAESTSASASMLATPSRWWTLIVGMGLLDAGAITAIVAAGTLPDAPFAAVTASGFGAVTVLIAAVVLRERVVVVQWFGIALITIGSSTLAA